MKKTVLTITRKTVHRGDKRKETDIIDKRIEKQTIRQTNTKTGRNKKERYSPNKKTILTLKTVQEKLSAKN